LPNSISLKTIVTTNCRFQHIFTISHLPVGSFLDAYFRDSTEKKLSLQGTERIPYLNILQSIDIRLLKALGTIHEKKSRLASSSLRCCRRSYRTYVQNFRFNFIFEGFFKKINWLTLSRFTMFISQSSWLKWSENFLLRQTKTIYTFYLYTIALVIALWRIHYS